MINHSATCAMVTGASDSNAVSLDEPRDTSRRWRSTDETSANEVSETRRYEKKLAWKDNEARVSETRRYEKKLA